MIGDMAGDRFALAIRIGGEIDIFLALGRLLELVDDLFLGENNGEIRREVFLDIDAELALGSIDHMADRRFDLKIPPQILFQGLGLGRGLNNN